MSYKLKFSEKGDADVDKWAASGQLKPLKKLFALFEELKEHPTTGTGQVEQLKGNHAGLWSRRIDRKSRLVYSINDNTVTVLVISAYGHYDDK